MIITKILHSVFFIFLTYILFLKFNNKQLLKKIHIKILFISFIFLYLLNMFSRYIANELFLFLIIFSLSIFVLQFIKKFIIVFDNNKVINQKERLNENILIIREFIFNKLIIILICIYQLLLIWFPAIYENIKYYEH